jgi:hypothetical protein
MLKVNPWYLFLKWQLLQSYPSQHRVPRVNKLLRRTYRRYLWLLLSFQTSLHSMRENWLYWKNILQTEWAHKIEFRVPEILFLPYSSLITWPSCWMQASQVASCLRAGTLFSAEPLMHHSWKSFRSWWKYHDHPHLQWDSSVPATLPSSLFFITWNYRLQLLNCLWVASSIIVWISFFFFIFLLLFICAYKAWFISPPGPHPLPYHSLVWISWGQAFYLVHYYILVSGQCLKMIHIVWILETREFVHL